MSEAVEGFEWLADGSVKGGSEGESDISRDVCRKFVRIYETSQTNLVSRMPWNQTRVSAHRVEGGKDGLFAPSMGIRPPPAANSRAGGGLSSAPVQLLLRQLQA